MGVRLLAASKPVNRSDWWKGRLALFQRLSAGPGEGQTSAQMLIIPIPTSGVRAFIHRMKVRGLHAETAVVSDSHLEIVISGLTSIILIVLGTVTHQFQGPFVSISLRPVHVMSTVWSSCS